MRTLATIAAMVVGLLVWTACVRATVVIDTVTVGNAGNAGELSGAGAGGWGPDRICGAVDYTYNIGKYEVTNSQYAEFLNSVATLGDPYGLYNANMGGGWNDIGGISRIGSGTAGDPWVYAARPNRGNRPVNYVTWYDSLRFANWMHNGQGSGDTEDGAYDMSLGASVVRKPGALVFLPSEDEWYKAAYYKGGGADAGYWNYPTQSDTVPTAEAPPGIDMVNGSANYYSGGYADPTYYTTEVGAYDARPSDSAYSTFDQGGNLWEWTEADVYGDGSFRGLRGGAFSYSASGGGYYLHAAYRFSADPANEWDNDYFGFRVAEVPEPAAIALLAAGALAAMRRKR